MHKLYALSICQFKLPIPRLRSRKHIVRKSVVTWLLKNNRMGQCKKHECFCGPLQPSSAKKRVLGGNFTLTHTHAYIIIWKSTHNKGVMKKRQKNPNFFRSWNKRKEAFHIIYVYVCRRQWYSIAATVAAQARKKKVFIKPTAERVLKPTADYMRQKASNGPSIPPKSHAQYQLFSPFPKKIATTEKSYLPSRGVLSCFA